MIKNILDLLQFDNFYGVSKRVDIAKGYYQIPKSFSDGKKQLIRVIKSKK
jgi:hypothetical protein